MTPAPTIRGASVCEPGQGERAPARASDKDAKLLLVCAPRQAGLLPAEPAEVLRLHQHPWCWRAAPTFNEVQVIATSAAVSPEEVKRGEGPWASCGTSGPRTASTPGSSPATARSPPKRCVAITEAAERFGNGEVAMTSRLTIEIQGVPYRQYRASPGVPGPVRLGHRRHRLQGAPGGILQGYHLPVRLDRHLRSQPRRSTSGSTRAINDVKLPHKFKIAVGGCPNNCVKPDLNDLGIIGQRVPMRSTWTSAAAARFARWTTPAPSTRAGSEGRQSGHRRQRLQPLRTLRGQVPLQGALEGFTRRVPRLYRRPLGQESGPGPVFGEGVSPTRKKS